MIIIPLLLLTLLVFGNVQGQDCATETAALARNPNITAAYEEFQQGILQQVQTCFTDDNTDCDVTVDTSNVGATCEAEGGVFSTPVVTYSCTNSNTNIETTVVYQYVVCYGTSCNSTQITNEINDVLDNATDAINEVLNPLGVNCNADVSAAVKLVDATAVLMFMGGLVTFLSLLW